MRPLRSTATEDAISIFQPGLGGDSGNSVSLSGREGEPCISDRNWADSADSPLIALSCAPTDRLSTSIKVADLRIAVRISTSLQKSIESQLGFYCVCLEKRI